MAFSRLEALSKSSRNESFNKFVSRCSVHNLLAKSASSYINGTLAPSTTMKGGLLLAQNLDAAADRGLLRL